MNYDVIVYDKAMADIVRNAQWWAENHSQDQAIKWYDAILAKVYSLEELPESNSLVPENGLFKYEIRQALFGLGSRAGYRIIFTVQGTKVHVLTIKAAEERWLESGDLDLIGP